MAKKSLRTPLDLPACHLEDVSKLRGPWILSAEAVKLAKGFEEFKRRVSFLHFWYSHFYRAAVTFALRQFHFCWHLAGIPCATMEKLLGVLVTRHGLQSALTSPWMQIMMNWL